MRSLITNLTIALLLAYIGAYLVLLRPMEISPGVHFRMYAIDRHTARKIFAPLEFLDRNIRPKYWVCEG